MRAGKKIVKDRVFYPGYILVKMNLDKESRHQVENINGVMSFVGPKGNPQPVTESEMARYLSSSESEDSSNEDVEEIPFKVGDSVKVIDGPFKEFNGLVQEINDKNRIKVNVNIFGRPTPIELSMNQILIES